MTRILIVDDDPNQLRILARVISLREKSMSVVTAADGRQAIALLERQPVDLVLTDLQMPELNGFEFIAWLVSNQPHIAVFTMTAYPDDDATRQLRELGSIECFTKPLDVAAVIERLLTTLERGVRGQIRNISLVSLLQLIEMERKTCTLSVVSEGRMGQIYLRDGESFDARWQEMEGTPAAIAIATWASPEITLTSGCAARHRTVDRPLRFIVMEAMRRLDEAERGPLVPEEDDLGAALDTSFPPEPETPPESEPPPPPRTPRRSLSMFPVVRPPEAAAILVVERATGRIRTMRGAFEQLEPRSKLVTELFVAHAAMLARLGVDDEIEEMVLTTASYGILVRPFASEVPSLVLLVFESANANLALQRLELDRFVSTMQAWASLKEAPQ